MQRTLSSFNNDKELVANWDALLRTFVRPENGTAKKTLLKYMEQILFGLQDFLHKHVGVTEEISLKELAEYFKETTINDLPEKKLTDVISDVIQDIAPHAVNVASPYFVGHMTSAVPFFMIHLETIVAALNQNVVKLETSKVASVIERQVLAKIHRLIYGMSEAFYQEHVQSTRTTLGAFTEGGTTANLTALWVARNAALAPKKGFRGIEAEGLMAAYRAYDIDRCVILVSRRQHYSIRKAAGILGIGNENIVTVKVDDRHRIDLNCLRQKISDLQQDKRTCILAIIGVAGATETGTVDPLYDLAEICAEHRIHFHVDAAWGGPTLMSEKYRHLLEGIERADSVTIDGHKQFYMPMGCGMVCFKDPEVMDGIAYHANYVNRRSSVDLGIKSLAGSRGAKSLILYSALKIMGTKGYSLLINHGIELARQFVREIASRSDFDVITPPELNIMTYRICPLSFKKVLKEGDFEQKRKINRRLNDINITVQRTQREAGNSFVSRTVLDMRNMSEYAPGYQPGDEMVVLRVVLMNPITNLEILKDILDEQEEIYQHAYGLNGEVPAC
jgi:glutamate decarboxylase